MATSELLEQAADRIETWFSHAWPLWIDRGLDPKGLFYEQLDFSSRPDEAVSRRMRVQGHQLYTFSRAVEAEHATALPCLRHALASIATYGWGIDAQPGGIHLLGPDSSPQDTLRDTYDQAFLLFGLHGAARAGLPNARQLADQTLAFIDTFLTERSDSSVREGVPASLPRRSNPHMHLLEAMLAWFELTGEQPFLDRANQIANVFAASLFDRAGGILGEFFTAEFQLAPPPMGEIVEPGHHFEWSWLLYRLAGFGGRDLIGEAGALHRWGLAHGLGSEDYAVDECDRSGDQTRPSRRIWPQTELIKSYLVNGQHDAAALLSLAVLDTYFATGTQGLWIDQFDQAGRQTSDVVPASTFYHIVVAFEDVLRCARSVQPD